MEGDQAPRQRLVSLSRTLGGALCPAGLKLVVPLLCSQQDTSWECTGPNHAAPARAAARSGDRRKGPSVTFLSCRGFSCISGLCCRRLLEGTWEKPVPSFPGSIALRRGHCNTEPFGTGVGGAGQSLHPRSCGCRAVAHQPDPFSAALMVLAHVCGCQLTSLSLQNSPDHGHPKGLSGSLARAGPSRALLAPQGLNHWLNFIPCFFLLVIDFYHSWCLHFGGLVILPAH